MKENAEKLIYFALELIAFMESKGVEINGVDSESIKKIILSSKKDISGLKGIVRDLAEWVRGYGEEGRVFELQLFDGVILSNDAEMIIRKGIIENEDEYRCLVSILDSYVEDNKNKEIRIVNEMLLYYENNFLNK